jgi:predicted RNA-binding protein (virulence factor B family)
MLQLGEFNELTIIRITDFGWFLEDEEENEVLLPNKFVTDDMKAGDQINVFLFKDSEDRITATTQKPLINLNEFASLRVKQINNVGAFLDWGLDKDLFVPFREQPFRMVEGNYYVVRLIHDEKTDRLLASARLNKYLEMDYITVKEGEEVEIIITQETDLGYKAIVEDAHLGLIYRNEVFQPISIGERMNAWVRSVREDGKIDLRLQKEGYGHIEPSSQDILDALTENDGFLPLYDKSKPEEIVRFFKMSKKTFKKAIGSLYKQRLIVLEDNGIRLKKK